MRQTLLAKNGVWRRPAMMTLTVDRRGFPNAEAAFRAITQGKYVARLMRALGVKLWLWALEFQQLTGEGWPHWHLLIDLSTVKGGRVDLAKAWKLWREKWGLGGLDLSVKKVTLKSAEHAVFYITKYLTKMPDGGFPVWVLNAHGIRFVQGCRKLGPLVNDAASKPKKISQDEEEKKNAPRRPLLARMAGCRQTSRVFAHQLQEDTGELTFKYLGSLPIPPSWLCDLSRRGKLSGKIHEGELGGKVAVLLEGASVDQIRREVESLPDLGEAHARIVELMAGNILASNVYAARHLVETGGDAAASREAAAASPPVSPWAQLEEEDAAAASIALPSLETNHA